MALSELITSNEFHEAIHQYIDSNKHIFVDDGENKLEYQIVFDNYIKIV